MFRSSRFWAGLAFSVGCLWLSVSVTPIAELSSSLGGGSYGWFLPGAVLQLLAIIARSQRWVELLDRRASLGDAFWAQSVGYLFTNLLPLRMGEPARVALMSTKCGLPFVQVAASAVIERLLDIATIVVVLMVVLPWMQVPPLVSSAGTALGVLALVALASLLVVARVGARAQGLLLLACRIVPAPWILAIAARWSELVAGLSPLARVAIATRVVAWSAATWVLSIGVYWCAIRMFEPSGNLLEAAFMLVALALAITVPSSPGFIGVFQLVGQQALVLPFAAKYDSSSALAITVAAHLTYYLVTTLLGVCGLWRFGQSFANLLTIISSRRRAEGEATGASTV